MAGSGTSYDSGDGSDSPIRWEFGCLIFAVVLLVVLLAWAIFRTHTG